MQKVRKRDEEAVREELKKVYRSADKESFLETVEKIQEKMGEDISGSSEELGRRVALSSYLPFLSGIWKEYHLHNQIS